MCSILRDQNLYLIPLDHMGLDIYDPFAEWSYFYLVSLFIFTSVALSFLGLFVEKREISSKPITILGTAIPLLIPVHIVIYIDRTVVWVKRRCSVLNYRNTRAMHNLRLHILFGRETRQIINKPPLDSRKRCLRWIAKKKRTWKTVTAATLDAHVKGFAVSAWRIIYL